MKKLLLLLLAVAGASTAWADDFVEMLTNGACNGTFDGWTVTNGGSGWAIETDENGNQYWVSSHGLCVLEQTFLLDEADADKIDQGNCELKASAMVRAPWEYAGTGRAARDAKVYVEMQDANDEVLYTLTVYDNLSMQTEWVTAEAGPTAVPAGTRKLKFVVQGRDGVVWNGNFGPQFRNLSLKIKISGGFSGGYQELLTNGTCDGTFDGWDREDAGSNGWAIGTDEDGSQFWASSYGLCTLYQTIDLSEKGYANADIDAGKVICKASAMIKAIWDPKNTGRGSTVAKVYVEMLDEGGNVLSTITVLDDKSIFLEWTLFQTDEFTLASGTRTLKFVVQGQDSAYWGGQYGPCFKNLSLQAKGGTSTACSHVWGEWTQTAYPTCTEDGSQTRTCERCGQTETETIPALGHNWNSEGICSRCGTNKLAEEGYTKLPYIVSTGEQAFNTGYIHKANTLVEMDCLVKKNQDRNYEALLGARLGNYQHNAFCFFSRFAGQDVPCFNRSGIEMTGEGFVYDERILLWCTYDNATWFRESAPLVEVGSIYNAGTVDDGKTPMFLFNLNTANTEGGVQADSSPCSMTLYSCKIHEDSDLVHHYIPAKNSEGVVGLYDLMTGTFAGSITATPFYYEAEEESYPITVAQAGLSIVIDCPGEAKPGDKVYVYYDYTGKATPKVEVLDENNNEIPTQIVSLGDYKDNLTFTMPASPVTVTFTTEPIIIDEIPDGCEVKTYVRNSGVIYSSQGKLYFYEGTGKFNVAFAPDGTVYIQDPAWAVDNEHSWVKGTYDEATSIISIPTGQFLTWQSGSQWGVQLNWGATEVYEEEDETGESAYYLACTEDQNVKTIEFLVEDNYLYLLNSQGNMHAEFPENYNATGMYLMYSDDSTFISLEYASSDADGNQLPFATMLNIAPAVPADPTIDGWYDCGDESGFSRLYFTMPTTDTNGNPIDQDLLSYSIFTDNGQGAELFTFQADVYYHDISEDLTEIPYTLIGFDFYSYSVYFYRTNTEGYEPFFTQRIGIQVYYTVDGVRNQSNIVWIDNPDGIDEVKADKDGTGKIYNLAGQRLEKPQKGINIIGDKKILVK